MITIISGTDRPQSQTRRVAQLVENHFKSNKIETQLIDLTQLPKDLFSGAFYFNAPAEFKPFQDKILNTDGIVTVTPEYNGSFPGALKYFIDMLKFPDSFRNMPCAFIGVAGGRFGALRSVEQLAMIYQYREAHIFAKRAFFMAVEEKISKDGSSITDEFTRGLFETCLNEFDQFVSALKKNKPA